MQIALLAVVEVRVGFPDFCQHRYAERQCVLGASEREPAVHPGLAEIAVHRVGLNASNVTTIINCGTKEYVL